MFADFKKQISATIDSAQKDLRQTVVNSLTTAASTLSQPAAGGPPKQHLGQGKTALFRKIWEHATSIRHKIIDRRDPSSKYSHYLTAYIIDGNIGAGADGRDEVQEKLVIFALLEKEFCELLEAYEIILTERSHLEQMIVGTSQLESIDDLELVGQYYRALQDKNHVSVAEVHRLAAELDSLKAVGVAKADSTLPKEESLEGADPSVHGLQIDRAVLAASDQEKKLLIQTLETQKMALETKNNYLKQQLSERESACAKAREESIVLRQELQKSQDLVEKDKLRILSLQEDLWLSTKQLKNNTTELQFLRSTRSSQQQTMEAIQHKHQMEVSRLEALLEEESRLSQELRRQVESLANQLSQMSSDLYEKEQHIAKMKQIPATSSLIRGVEIDGNDAGSSRRGSIERRLQTSEATIQALRKECEQLAIENAKLRENVNIDYLRNIFLRYMQLPDQRETLLKVLAQLFKYSPEELSKVAQ